jgi:exopolyphosphatase/guanosine-5'-triphosphate,3'-diphosphate pyrophosphatase
MAQAAIDIGSNSILLTVVDDAARVVHDEATVVGLGRGLGDRGLFAPDRMAAAEAVLTTYVQTAQKYGITPGSIRIAATSAARRAMNAATFFQKLHRSLGIRVKIITGEEEARLTWVGARRLLDVPPGPVLVIDLGGGSTELVLGEGDHVYLRVSLEIGSVRLTEQFLGTGLHEPAGLARVRNRIETEVAPLRLDPMPRTVIGVAGTATTLTAMALGLDHWDASIVHGSKLTRTDLARFADQLLAATPEERRRLAAVSPERADYLLAGAAILDRILQASRRPQLTASDGGLRYGLLSEP